MKLGEVVVHMSTTTVVELLQLWYYNFSKFHLNRMKNQKILLIVRFTPTIPAAPILAKTKQHTVPYSF